MKYINVPRGHLDPHIFAIADGAYQGMISENRNQVTILKHAMTSTMTCIYLTLSHVISGVRHVTTLVLPQILWL